MYSKPLPVRTVSPVEGYLPVSSLEQDCIYIGLKSPARVAFVPIDMGGRLEEALHQTSEELKTDEKWANFQQALAEQGTEWKVSNSPDDHPPLVLELRNKNQRWSLQVFPVPNTFRDGNKYGRVVLRDEESQKLVVVNLKGTMYSKGMGVSTPQVLPLTRENISANECKIAPTV